jgi:MinD-like ATPase involved in chromosome partitioning or flagellar assembly
VYIITFYSFKGGVGRTMALVNTGAELARRGRKVLLVDFDLEAPGLSTYDLLRPPEPHPGIVEYVTEFRQTRHSPRVTDFIYQARPVGKRGGRLWVMPAGRGDAEYRRMLNALSWRALYQEEEGFLLFEDTRLQWDAELHPDYVLIDARTGHTDIEGICTRQLADAVVVVFYPNEQNLAGLREVCRHIRAEETSGLKKKIQLHFVASNVPDLDDENRILRRQLQAFHEGLGFRELAGKIKRYESLSLLDQSVFTLDHPHSKLARSYRRLLRTLLKENLADRNGAMLFLEDYPGRIKARESGGVKVTNYRVGEDAESWGGRKDAEKWDAREDKNRLHRIARHFKEDVEILTKVADCFMKEEAYKTASSILDQVLRLEPNRGSSLFQRAVCKANLLQLDEAAEDLLSCLRAEGTLSLKASCVRRLADMHPGKLSKLAEMVEAQGIHGLPLEIVADCLCHSEEGVPVAARLLREHLTELDEEHLWLRLLYARCWKELIQLDRSGKLQAGATGLFALALAHWGENGELPESLCRQALESDAGSLSSLWGDEAIGWLLWRVGEVAAAIEWLDRAEQQARAEPEYEVFSLWRLRDVSLDQYLDDCRLVRRMFQGEPIRPAFLGPPR